MTDQVVPSAVPTFPCPVCRQPVMVGQMVCQNPNCQVDLRSLAIMDTICDSLFLLAQQQVSRGESRKAIQTLESVIAFQPEHLEAWVMLAKAYAAIGNPGEANRCWQKVLYLKPNEPRAQTELARKRQAEEAVQRQAKRKQLLIGILPAAGMFVIFLVVLAVVLTGRKPAPQVAAASTTAPQPTTAPTALPDLTKGLSAAIQSDPTLKDFQIKIQQEGSAVALSGELPSQSLKDKVDAIVKTFPELTLVDTTRLTVVPPALAAAVKEKLAAVPELANQNVNVQQDGATILLDGTVDSIALKQLAEETAGSVKDVNFVDSHKLSVTPVLYVDLVNKALKADPRTSCFNISVSQQGARIFLNGKVYSQQAVETTQLLTYRVNGVQAVDISQLTVETPYAEYVVQAGDFLEKVAEKVYGSSANSKLIYKANPGKFPLHPGYVLKIPPEGWSAFHMPIVDCTSAK